MSKTLWVFLLVVVTLFWGNSFIAIKHVVKYVTPLELVTMRFFPVALVFAAMLLPLHGHRVWELIRTQGWRLTLLGLTGAVFYNIFLAWGETRIAAGTASLIIALNPAFIYSMSVLFLHEELMWKRVLGLIIAFGGLIIIVRFGSRHPVTIDNVTYTLIINVSTAHVVSLYGFR